MTRSTFLLQLILALLLAALALPLAGAPARAQPPATAPAPPAPPSFGLPDPPPPPAKQALVCAQALADPAVSQPAASSPWRELRDDRDFVTDQFLSPPQSIRMAEDDDGYDENGDDVDTFGQVFAVPAGAQLLYGSLAYHVAGTPGEGEQIEVALYRGDSLVAGNRVATFSAPTAGRLDEWRQLDWELADAGLVGRLAERGQALIAVSLRSRAGARQTVWVDDIRANVCGASAAISGRVTQNGLSTGLAGARLLLVRSENGGQRVVAATTADDAGAFRFEGAPPLAGGASYRVWFLNGPGGDGRAAFWAGPRVDALSTGQQVELPAFDIGDIPLLAPTSYAEAALGPASPVRLTWASRGVPGERYQACLYDPARIDPASGQPPQLCSPVLDPARDQLSFALTPALLAGSPQLGFAYGRGYRWYVAAVRLNSQGQVEQFGYSRFERAITLTAQAVPAPSEPSADEPGLPAASPDAGDWTVMVYAAGDNALSDPRRGPGVSRVEAQLARLAALAPRFPGVRLVTYADLYGDTGARLCYLRPAGGPDCRRRAEPDSASPATVRAFVTTALQRYPARRAMLLLIGPGHAVAGFGTDETTPGAPTMPLDGLAAAVAQATAAAGRPLDVVAFRAPLIGELGAVRAMAGSASYMLAASDQIWHVAWLERMLPLLSGASKEDPRAVAVGAVAAYDQAVAALRPARAGVMAAYDLGRAGAAQAALDRLGAALTAALDQDEAGTLALLATARGAAQRYDASGNGMLGRMLAGQGTAPADDDAFFDAADLAGLVAASPLATPEAKAAASALASAVSGPTPLVIAAARRSGASVANQPVNLDRAGGLALFLPAPTNLGGQRTLAELALAGQGARTGAWADLLRRYLAVAPSEAPGAISAAPSGGARFAPPTGGTLGLNLWLPAVDR